MHMTPRQTHPPSPRLARYGLPSASSPLDSFANQTEGHYAEALTHLQTFRKYSICARPEKTEGEGEEIQEGMDAGIQWVR